MSSEWPLVKFHNVIELVGGGTPKTTESSFWNGVIPWLSVADFNSVPRWVSGAEKSITELGLAQSSTKLLNAGDIIISARGTVGALAQLGRPMAFNQSCYGVRGISGVADTNFIFYALKLAVKSMKQLAHGGVFDTITRDTFKSIDLLLPSIKEQCAIAHILGSLDDKIELNRKQNETLEAIAQAIFKSWFIDFDPVRAKMEGRAPAGMDEETAALFPDELVESELGLVPKGWIYCSLRDVVDIFDSKRIPLSGAERATRKGSFPYYGAAALMDRVDDYLFDGIHLLLGEDGTVTDSHGYPVAQYVWGKFWVNNHAHILKGKNGISTEHVMLSLKRTNIQALITGAVQAKLSQSNMWRINFLKPTEKIAESFGKILESIYIQYRHNVELERTLEGIRDTLLPRLISGKLPVDAAMAETL